jgi:hypothetical protein
MSTWVLCVWLHRLGRTRDFGGSERNSERRESAEELAKQVNIRSSNPGTGTLLFQEIAADATGSFAGNSANTPHLSIAFHRYPQ